MNKLKTVSVYLIFFYLIYTPEFFLAKGINLPSHYIVLLVNILIFYSILINMTIRNGYHFKMDYHTKRFYLISIISSIYFMVVAIYTNNEPRILQNIYFLFQYFSIYYLLSYLKKKGYTKDNLIKLILNTVLIQSILVIITVFNSEAKSIALNLYYLGRNENVFISQKRIFGFMGEYTYFTPIFHSIIAIMIIYLFLFERRNYLYYLPLIFVTILLNGRSGFLFFIISFLFLLVIYAFKNVNKIFTSLLYFILLVMFIILVGFSIKLISENIFIWIMGSINDIKNFLLYSEKSGNIEVLSNMLYFPEGWALIFGNGLRLYGNNKDMIHSDIGYVNDLFMGGLIYCSILYGNVILYVKTNKNNTKYFSYALLLIFFLSNIKGEAARGGLILIGLLLTKNIINYEISKEGEINDIDNNTNL
ncbi:hypothetical protein [Vagococcus lutrae]|uniref:hypothetical protein n=1 Tax=Vagococcus lutrae TaxID=81947 RepID=UPI0028925E87|nr:hypothetical protein [Vagococcus lutrae]MDT2805867.1 hypothetical protein [Vagococcus lutrae]